MVVNYQCQRCGHRTFNKKDMGKHISRKNPCKPLLKDIPASYIDISNIIYKCNDCEFVTLIKEEFDKHHKGCKDNIIANLKIEQEKQKLVNWTLKNNKLMLQGQGKNFVQNNNQIIQQQNNNQTITQNNLNQNNSFQFTLNPWTSPDMNHITNVDYYNCISSEDNSILKFTKMLYFDPNVPQNHSIYIDKNKKIMAFREDKTWCPKDDDFVEDLIDSNDRYMDRWSIDNEDNEEFKDARKLYREARDIVSGNLENIKSSLMDEIYANKTMVYNTSKLLCSE